MNRDAARRSRYTIALAAVAGVILIGGWLARPHDLPDAPAPAPSQTELEQLARRAERRSLENTVDYFAGVARDMSPSIVQLGDASTSGVAWTRRDVITPASPDAYGHDQTTIAVDGSKVSLQRSVWGPDLPVTLLQSEEELAALNPVRRAESLPNQGAWVVVVWRAAADRAFASGNYLGVQSSVCQTQQVEEVILSQSLTSAMRGGGLFDTDGGLLGVVVACGDRFAAVTAASVDRVLAQEATLERRLMQRFGIRLTAPTPQEQLHFGDAKGVVVRELWIGSPAELSGLHAGDVITAVGEATVTNVDDARTQLTAVSEPVLVRVRHGRRTVNLTLDGESAVAEPTSRGIVWQAEEGYAIRSVVPGSRAASAGLVAGDRVIRVDHETPSGMTHIQRMLSNARRSPALLEVQRGQRRLAMLYPPVETP